MWKRLQFLMNAEGMQGGEPAPASSNSGGEAPFTGGTPGWGLPANQAASGQNPLLADVQPPAAPPAPAAQAVETIDFAGRKVEVNDPAVLAILKDVQKDYTSLQGTYTQTSQQLKALESERNTLMQLIQNQQAQQAQPPAQQNQAPTPEDLAAAKDAFMDRFYEDPMAAIGELLDKQFQTKVQPVIEPISQERQWNEQIKEVSTKFADFNDHIEPMRQVLQEMPHLAEQGLETVYFVAKGRTAQAPVNPAQLASDPQFLQQHVLSNPEVQQQILSKYYADKQQTNQGIPPVMGGQPGGQPPAIPQDRPTTIRAASKAFMKSLGL